MIYFVTFPYLFYKFMYCLSTVVIVLCDEQFSNQNNYLKCHYHRRPSRRNSGRRYVVGGSLLPTTSPTDGANTKERCIKCISHRVILPTELPTDRENYDR
jgi:hypothetical protein